MTLSISNVAALAACDAIVDLCDTGTTDAQANIVIYSGSVPANVDTALGAQVVLAELEMSNPAFGAAADAAPNATATASAITDDTTANAMGTASFFRILNRDNTAVIQGAVGATGSGDELELNSTSIQPGATVEITSLTVTMPEA
tara:strand:- start:5706 stop:6140 length:435 start_codon:yes stop_codon:yes gene_type:complete